MSDVNARKYLRRAIALDPNYALAFASLAEASATRDLYFTTDAAAVELDPTLFDAPYTYARILALQSKPEAAVAYFEIAASIHPIEGRFES